jgi:hypothetical protein
MDNSACLMPDIFALAMNNSFVAREVVFEGQLREGNLSDGLLAAAEDCAAGLA